MNIDFAKGGGLVPAIVQEHDSGEVLMLGYMNAEALTQTQDTGWMHFYSRSKERLWKKGETSGNQLKVRSMFVDCDRDTLLFRVDVVGTGVCHTGNYSCFFTPGEDL
ncbi:MAG: phosphoribosyl-AMP cyclohydrolase [Corynebacteriales bacterium]|nr:phosphoribosyl-AMP cyclohydrolase [Mycobacteriales bacterium]